MDSRYQTVRRVVDPETKRTYLLNTLYPDLPESENDWYVITTEGDRYDLLSQQFYSTAEYWWVIAIANNQPTDTICPEPGIQLRIPAVPTKYLTLLDRENR